MNSNSAIVFLLLSIGIFYTFTSGQYEEVKRLHALANEYQEILRNISGVAELRDNLSVAYQALPAEEVDRLTKALPDYNDTVRLALDLDGIAGRHGISLKSINAIAGPDANAGGLVLPDGNVYDKVNITLSFVAKYPDFVSFLSDLELNLRLMDVRSISFNAGDTGLYEYIVTLDTYWLR